MTANNRTGKEDLFCLVELNDDGSFNDDSGVVTRKNLDKMLKAFGDVAPEFLICKLVPVEFVTCKTQKVFTREPLE